MANQKHHNVPAAVPDGGYAGTLQDWQDRAHGAEAKMEEAKSGLRELQGRLDTVSKSLQSQDALHAQEKKRLEDQITFLQRHTKSTFVPDDGTAESALKQIIDQLASVAFGGPAAALRSVVHTTASSLEQSEKQKLREYAVRLRAAAEAVEQESTTILL